MNKAVILRIYAFSPFPEKIISRFANYLGSGKVAPEALSVPLPGFFQEAGKTIRKQQVSQPST